MGKVRLELSVIHHIGISKSRFFNLLFVSEDLFGGWGGNTESTIIFSFFVDELIFCISFSCWSSEETSLQGWLSLLSSWSISINSSVVIISGSGGTTVSGVSGFSITIKVSIFSVELISSSWFSWFSKLFVGGKI